MSCPDHLPEMSAFIIVVPTPNRYIPDIGMVVSGGEDGAVEIVIQPSPSNQIRTIGHFTHPRLYPVICQRLIRFVLLIISKTAGIRSEEHTSELQPRGQ